MADSAPTIIESGARARVTETHRGPDGTRWREGTMLVVDDYIPAEDSDDGVPFYLVSDDGGGFFAGFDIDASKIVQVSSAREAANREVSSKSVVRNEIDWLGGFGDAIDFHESEWNGEDGVTLLGKAENGLDIVVTVKIESVERQGI